MIDLNPRSARRRAPLEEFPDGGFWKGMSMALLLSTPAWGLLAWVIASVWRGL